MSNRLDLNDKIGIAHRIFANPPMQGLTEFEMHQLRRGAFDVAPNDTGGVTLTMHEQDGTFKPSNRYS